MFKIAIGILKLPLSYLDELTFHELGLLIESHVEQQQDHYEMVKQAFRIGYISAKKGKDIQMFEKQQKNKVTKVTKEYKQEELAKLNQIFRGSH